MNNDYFARGTKLAEHKKIEGYFNEYSRVLSTRISTLCIKKMIDKFFTIFEIWFMVSELRTVF